MDHVITFMIYSYIGATFETLSKFIANGGLLVEKIKRKYDVIAINPIIDAFPIYGMGAYMIYIMNINLARLGVKNILVRGVMCGMMVTLFEYMMGVAVKAGEDETYIKTWDYRDVPLNIDGKTSVKHAIYWIIASILVIKYHPKLLKGIRCGLECGRRK